MKVYLPLAERACGYLSSSTDPFHAVWNAIKLLEGSGFSRWKLGERVEAGSKLYYTVGQSTLVAFCVGAAEAAQGGEGVRAFRIVGGHTDSPNLRVKPRSKSPANKNHKCIQLGVECYGGGLWHTWLDRDLGLSGRVLVRGDDQNHPKIASKLVQISDPIARISSLCIHLQTDTERKALEINKETHTVPIIASEAIKPAVEDAASQIINGAIDPQNKNSNTSNDTWLEHQEPLLLKRIAQQLDIPVSKIADWDLSLYDVQPAVIGGMQSEFLYSGRLDNLATVFCAVTALTEHATQALHDDSDISMICCFDHEEVGSVSSHGAGSPVLEEAMRRVSTALGQYQQQPEVIAKSFCMSVDQAHAVHPNYAAKHENQHGPTLNSGIVIKTNSNQRYSTNSLTAFIVRELGRKLNIPIQEFVVRNDCPCGSTIGPTISARTGLRTVDAGMSQLSMHSCREVMGVADLTHCVNLFRGFFRHFKEIDEALLLD